jgi:hypothetical protein
MVSIRVSAVFNTPDNLFSTRYAPALGANSGFKKKSLVIKLGLAHAQQSSLCVH